MNKRELGLEHVQLRAAEEGDGHTIEGIAVPFNTVIRTWFGQEQFDPECVFDDVETAKLCYQHGEPIGRIINSESQADGLHITARISDTTEGRDAITLLRDGVLDSLSVGFIPLDYEDDANGVTHYKRVRLLETSIVSWPAYQDAKITSQRNQQTTIIERNKQVDEETKNAITELRTDMRSLQDVVSKHQEEPQSTVGAQFRSSAEYLIALKEGDPTAFNVQAQCRDLISSTDTAQAATWIADDIRLIQERRKVSNMLKHDSLPDKGMSMEYYVLAQDTTKVDKQTSEGADLAFGKLKFGTRTVDINTYGGYTQLSRQVIQRANAPMLTTALAAMRNAYARTTENAVRTYLYEQIKTQRDASSDPNKIDTPQALASMTIDDWAQVIVQAAELADDRNVQLTRLGVSQDVLLKLLSLKDSGSRFFDLSSQGSDTIGSFDLTGITGSFMRVPVQLMPKAPTGTACFIDPEAVTVWESGGPTQLTDTDSVKLVDSYSVYGYMAVAATNPLGLIPLKFKAA